MVNLPPLIQDLGLILIAAAAMLLLFKWLRQPVILGYLLAGFFVSNYFPPEWAHQYLPEALTKFLTIQDGENIKVWAEIGVIFMLFGLGLEFSFKKLLSVGRTASITGGFEVVSTTVLGFFVGKMFGWNNMDSIFFGAMLAMSSTTIILKVFDDLKMKAKAFAPIVFGALIVEDLLAMLLLVLLGSIAISQQFEGGALFLESTKLIFFLVLWVVMGIFLIPWFLKRCKRFMNEELLLLISVGLCFLMVIIACDVGFSSALGAFVMGSILAETSRGIQIERVVRPVRDLFSAVFFVSVGMMIDPAILYEYAGTIIIITILTVFIKFWGTGMGALLAGCNVRNSMQAGMSMAQIGEFSFIIATLGYTLGVISDFLYPIAVATSAITTLTTPYLILSSDKIARWLDKRIPERLELLLLRYEVTMNEQIGRESALSLFWRTHGLAIMLNSIIVVGIILGARLILSETHVTPEPMTNSVAVVAEDAMLPDTRESSENKITERRTAAAPTLLDTHDITPFSLSLLAITILVASPFLWGVFQGRPPRPDRYDTKTLRRLRRLQFGISTVRFLVGSMLVVFFVASFLDMPSAPGLLTAFGIVCFLSVGGRTIDRLYQRIETRFVDHLSEKERAIVEDRSALPHLVPWEATLTEYTLSEYSPLVMNTVRDSNLKQKQGVTVAIIRRGENTIVAPKADEYLLPRDRLYLIGTYEQLIAAQAVIEYQPETELAFDDDQFGMVPLRLHQEHTFVGKTIRDCGIRESVNGLIVGVERNEERFLNPDPNMVLGDGDLIWLVGEKQLLTKL